MFNMPSLSANFKSTTLLCLNMDKKHFHTRLSSVTLNGSLSNPANSSFQSELQYTDCGSEWRRKKRRPLTFLSRSVWLCRNRPSLYSLWRHSSSKKGCNKRTKKYEHEHMITIWSLCEVLLDKGVLLTDNRFVCIWRSYGTFWNKYKVIFWFKKEVEV